MRITREQAQICSTFSMVLGISLMISTHYVTQGVAMVGIAVWILTVSESVLLVKVEREMRFAMEALARQKSQEVEEVLYFLRQSSISASPFESIEGAKKLCEKTDFPSMVVDTAHQIVNANEKMHKLLGWDPSTRDLNGTPVYLINNPAVLSKLGGLATKPEVQDRKSMATNYVYVHKSGEEICGQLVFHKIKNEAFFAIFHPEKDHAISRGEIKKLIDIK